MQKYFISEGDLLNNKITGSDVFHIKNVMRNRIGDNILVCDQKKTFLVTITAIKDNEVIFEIKEERCGNVELPHFITIFQGFPKGDKIEEIIKHGTELGASEFVPVLMKRSVFKLDPKKKDNKLVRYNTIAKEAAEQAHRDFVPKVSDIISLKNIDFSHYTTKIVCYEEVAKSGELTAFKQAIKKLREDEKVAILVGPEGGIDDSEIEYLKEKGFIVASVGKRILRTETVVFYCLSAISYEWELK